MMALLTWWRSDPHPSLEPIEGFSARATRDMHLIAKLAHLPLEDVHTRLDVGHRPYVARLGSTPVAYDCVAGRQASIGELKHTVDLLPWDRYLWDFATVPAWRGRGVYPRLLQAILEQEYAANRFWIIHAPENRASARGIQKAGFQVVGELSFLPNGLVRLAASGRLHHVAIGAILFKIPLLHAAHDTLSPCWRCAITPEEPCSTPNLGKSDPETQRSQPITRMPYTRRGVLFTVCGDTCTCVQS
jgi:RimJ/RimL family protein N-acetyltransferase